jgi:NAD(P)-dependent dehydrogenase (short-subunit alcohol dehydrogenase family)
MSNLLVTGSADGLGQMAAQRLVVAGHQVMLRARSDAQRRAATRGDAAVPEAAGVLIADPAVITQTRELARAGQRARTL